MVKYRSHQCPKCQHNRSIPDSPTLLCFAKRGERLYSYTLYGIHPALIAVKNATDRDCMYYTKKGSTE